MKYERMTIKTHTVLLSYLGMVIHFLTREINTITNDTLLTIHPDILSCQVPSFPAVMYASWKFFHGRNQHKCCTWYTNYKPKLTKNTPLCGDVSHHNDQALEPGQTAMAGEHWL